MLHSLPYSIPSEYVVGDEEFTEKHICVSEIETGVPYRYGHLDEEAYLNSYRRARFAKTKKKGGWDCLRHYEIMAAGCIPLFEGLADCPTLTMVTLPKSLILEAERELSRDDIDIEKYDRYRVRMLRWVRDNCTAEAVFQKIFIPNVRKNFKKVLLIRGHIGVNYSREMTWIGMIRHLQNVEDSVVGELPRIPYLYADFPLEDTKGLYGNGFGYARKLDPSRPTLTDDNEIEEKTRGGYWDLIVYGKTGPDEHEEGGEGRALWQLVKERYSKDQIAFIYGGDEPFNLRRRDRHTAHLAISLQHGTCFVRELQP